MKNHLLHAPDIDISLTVRTWFGPWPVAPLKCFVYLDRSTPWVRAQLRDLYNLLQIFFHKFLPSSNGCLHNTHNVSCQIFYWSQSQWWSQSHEESQGLVFSPSQWHRTSDCLLYCRKYAITSSNQILFTLPSKIHSNNSSQSSPSLTCVWIYLGCVILIHKPCRYKRTLASMQCKCHIFAIDYSPTTLHRRAAPNSREVTYLLGISELAVTREWFVHKI